MNPSFFIENRKKLMEAVEDNTITVLFAGKAPYKSADEVYSFTPNRNFYYATGIDRENMILLLQKKNQEIKETLFIERHNEELAKWVGDRLRKEEIEPISGIKEVQYIEDFESTFSQAWFKSGYPALYLDLERREWDQSPTRAQEFATGLRTKYPAISLRDIYPTISSLRVIKTPEEVETIQKAIQITQEGIQEMMRHAKPGMMEYEIEAYFDFVLTKSGVKDKAFHTIAAAGKNAAILHYHNNDSKTGEEDLILFDLGAQWQYYNADITRTFPVSGKFTERQKQLYDIILKAQLAVIEAIQPGVPFKRLNEIVLEIYREELKKIGLIQEDQEVSRYYYHGVSHFLGADTHDVGDREVELQPGMVLTVEPGLYIEEEGIGIRIEDDVLVTESGHEVLSKDIIKTVEDIEAFMQP